MVNSGVWHSRRTVYWTKDGEDVELVMAGVSIGYIGAA